MNEKIPLKSIALGTALVIASGMIFSSVNTVEVTQALDEPQLNQTSAYEEVYETTASDDYIEEDYEVTTWWKAVLSDYDETLSPSALTEEETTTAEETSESQTEETSNSISETDAQTQETTVQTENQPANTIKIPEQVQHDYEQIQANSFCFKTYGYGHGVGMSQNGANYYATYAGYDYKQILAHYYPGTYLSNTGTAYSEYLTVRGVTNTALNIVSMVCYAEVGTTMNPEAIKAQAIAAYTNIKYCGGNTNGMAIKSNPPAELIETVRSVLGTAVYYDGELALTSFYASSAGHTASSKDVFSMDLPYLKSVVSEYDSICDPHYGEITQMDRETVRKKLQNYLGITLSNNYSNWFAVTRGDGGIAATITVDGQVTVKGYELAYALGLKSPFVEISYH